MQRYKLVIGGTIAGIAGVLAFPTKGSHLTIPTAGSGSAATGASTGASSGSSASAGSSGSSGSSTTSSGSAATSSGSAATSSGGGSSGRSASSSGGSSATASATRSATSSDQTFRYGDMAVKVTVSGTKITNVSMAALNETDGRSVAIDSYAVPQLEHQVISAGSVNINGVSGATFTSQAFVDAVANALSKLGIKA